MRKAPLAAALALLAAAPAFAVIHGSSSATVASGSTGTTASAPTTGSTLVTSPAPTAAMSASGGSGPAPTPATAGGNPFLGSPMQLANTTGVDNRAAATNEVVQASHSSGLTSENTGVGVASNQTSTGTGVASGNLASGGVNENIPGTPSPSGNTTGTSTGTTAANAFVNPGIAGAYGGSFAEGDQVLFDANGNAIGTSGTLGMANTVTSPAPVNNGITASDLVLADRAMNQVIAGSRAARHRAGRNGQLLYSITPRTDVDRSNEMPDDGPLAFAGPVR